MDILMPNNSVYRLEDVLSGIRGLSPYEQIRFVAEIIKSLRQDVKEAESSLAEKDQVSRGTAARDALKILKDNF